MQFRNKQLFFINVIRVNSGNLCLSFYAFNNQINTNLLRNYNNYKLLYLLQYDEFIEKY